MPKSTQDLLKEAQDAATKLHSLCGVRAELTEKLEANRIEIEKAEAATRTALGAYHEAVGLTAPVPRSSREMAAAMKVRMDAISSTRPQPPPAPPKPETPSKGQSFNA